MIDISALKKVLTIILLSDFMRLPPWIKDDLLLWKGNKDKLAQRRLLHMGMSLRTYEKGKPETLFPNGYKKPKQRGWKRQWLKGPKVR